MKFHCNNIILGSAMAEHQNFLAAKMLPQRDIISQMNAYTQSTGKRTGILFGLRRTGKTILLQQWLLHLPYEERKKAAFISIEGEDFIDIKHDLNILRDKGYRYIVLDEVTSSENYIECCSSLSDNYCASGMKIFIAGTDSLSLFFSITDGLYDREYTLHTTHIPYAEWARIKQTQSLDGYIQYGGLLHIEPTTGEIAHSIPLKWTADDARRYFTAAISNNICNSIRNYKEGEADILLSSLLNEQDMDKALYGLFGSITRQEFALEMDDIASIEDRYLISALQSLLLTDSHAYNESIMRKNFKLPDIVRTKSAFAKKNEALYTAMKDIAKDVRKDAESLLQVKNNINKYVQPAQFIHLVEYLRNLEVFAMRPSKAFLPYNESIEDRELYKALNIELHTQNLVSQPGLRYAQADIMRKLIEENPIFEKLSDTEKKICIETFLDGVFGILQEDCILYETMQQCKRFGKIQPGNNDWITYASLPIKAYKAVFPRTVSDPVDKEIDLVIEDKRNKSFVLLEIKHSDKRHINQTKWLNDANVRKRLTREKGSIDSSFVLYTGKSCHENGVHYLSVTEYLTILHTSGIDETLRWLHDEGRPHRNWPISADLHDSSSFLSSVQAESDLRRDNQEEDPSEDNSPSP